MKIDPKEVIRLHETHAVKRIRQGVSVRKAFDEMQARTRSERLAIVCADLNAPIVRYRGQVLQ